MLFDRMGSIDHTFLVFGKAFRLNADRPVGAGNVATETSIAHSQIERHLAGLAGYGAGRAKGNAVPAMVTGLIINGYFETTINFQLAGPGQESKAQIFYGARQSEEGICRNVGNHDQVSGVGQQTADFNPGQILAVTFPESTFFVGISS